MTVWTPDWKLTVAGVDYTDIAISDIAHQAGRDDIYTQPNPSYLQVQLVALSGQTLPFGKHKGRLIKDVAIEDLPYLLWYFRECQEKLSPNCVAALKFHLNIK